MRRIIKQILIIIFAIFIAIASILITNVNAESVAGLNVPPSVNSGENFSVALILPSNAYSAESSVTVKYSDGSTDTKKIVYMNGMNDFPNSVTFTAKAAGTATVTANNIVISDSASNAIENGGSKTGTITVNNSGSGETPAAPTTNNNTSGATNNTVTFKDVNETVYTTGRCNVRESYSTSSNKITTLNVGASVKRTGTSDSGWSRVEYNGKTAYISSQFLTTTKPADPTFKQTNDTMYAIQDCNLRKSWSTDSDKVGYLKKGEEVTRLGVADNGWSKIKHNGSEVYVATRLLSSDEPEEEDTNTTNEVTNEVTNQVTNEVVTENKTELDKIKEEIGVLPEVGNNIATSIYKIVLLIAVIMVVVIYRVYYKLNKDEEI